MYSLQDGRPAPPRDLCPLRRSTSPYRIRCFWPGASRLNAVCSEGREKACRVATGGNNERLCSHSERGKAVSHSSRRRGPRREACRRGRGDRGTRQGLPARDRTGSACRASSRGRRPRQGAGAEEDRGEKILVFKRRRRKGYRKTAGHRQYFTALRISEILFKGAVLRAQDEGPKQAQKKIAEATAPARTKKDDAAKGRKEKKKPERAGVSAVKEDKSIPQKAEPPRPAEQPRAGSGPSTAPAPVERDSSGSAGSAAVKEKIARPEEKYDARQSEEHALPTKEQAPALPARNDDTPPSLTRSETDKTTDKPNAFDRRRTAIAVAAALLLLAIILLLWGKSPFTGSQSTLAPAPMTVQPADIGPKKAKAPVPEKAIEGTTPVDKPSAPAQPPD